MRLPDGAHCAVCSFHLVFRVFGDLVAGVREWRGYCAKPEPKTIISDHFPVPEDEQEWWMMDNGQSLKHRYARICP